MVQDSVWWCEEERYDEGQCVGWCGVGRKCVVGVWGLRCGVGDCIVVWGLWSGVVWCEGFGVVWGLWSGVVWEESVWCGGCGLVLCGRKVCGVVC